MPPKPPPKRQRNSRRSKRSGGATRTSFASPMSAACVMKIGQAWIRIRSLSWMGHRIGALRSIHEHEFRAVEKHAAGVGQAVFVGVGAEMLFFRKPRRA